MPAKTMPKGLTLVQVGRKFYTLKLRYSLEKFDVKKLKKLINQNRMFLLKRE